MAEGGEEGFLWGGEKRGLGLVVAGEEWGGVTGEGEKDFVEHDGGSCVVPLLFISNRIFGCSELREVAVRLLCSFARKEPVNEILL